jgi:glycine/D-amino acid oxidase-like deaminating enzyme
LHKTFDYCVIGAGLAGLHTAYELIRHGVSVCVIDTNGVATGASGAPVGLANPATGRFATKTWKGEESLKQLSFNLQQAEGFSTSKFYRQTGVLRPALDVKIALKMQKNIETDSWRNERVAWLNEQEVKDFHPGIHCEIGGIWVSKGITVHIAEYLNALKKMIEEKHGIFYLYEDYTIKQAGNWNIQFRFRDVILSKHIIHTAGIWTKSSPFWNSLKMHPIKGQTLILETENHPLFDHAVSALGYISRIKDNTYILGSTYEHTFDHEHPDKAGEKYMLDNLSRVLPRLAKKVQIKDSWASVRASTPNRKPYLGAHPTISNCYVFAGLGSKGLLYSSLGARYLANHLINDESLPIELKVQR